MQVPLGEAGGFPKTVNLNLFADNKEPDRYNEIYR